MAEIVLCNEHRTCLSSTMLVWILVVLGLLSWSFHIIGLLLLSSYTCCHLLRFSVGRLVALLIFGTWNVSIKCENWGIKRLFEVNVGWKTSRVRSWMSEIGYIVHCQYVILIFGVTVGLLERVSEWIERQNIEAERTSSCMMCALLFPKGIRT